MEADSIDQYPFLRIAVYRNSLLKDSLGIILGRLKLQRPQDNRLRVSYEAINKHIYLNPHG